MEQKQPNIQTREDACRWAVMRVRALIADEADWVTNLANASAAIFECWKEVSWAGFYLMKKGELVLGPFQGKPACRRIAVGKGVCGTAAAEQKTQLEADVHQFPGHIACDGGSNSEIVVPMLLDGKFASASTISSPCPISHKIFKSSGVRSGESPFNICCSSDYLYKGPYCLHAA